MRIPEVFSHLLETVQLQELSVLIIKTLLAFVGQICIVLGDVGFSLL